MKKCCLSIVAAFFALSLSAQENLPFRKGYRGNVEIQTSALVGKGSFGGMVAVTTTHGYSFGDGAFVGIGTGYALDLDSQWYLPVFLEAKYNFIDRNTSPFVEVRAGMLENPERFASASVALAGGADFGRISVKVGYEFAQAHQDTESGVAIQGKSNILFCGFAFNF